MPNTHCNRTPTLARQVSLEMETVIFAAEESISTELVMRPRTPMQLDIANYVKSYRSDSYEWPDGR